MGLLSGYICGEDEGYNEGRKKIYNAVLKICEEEEVLISKKDPKSETRRNCPLEEILDKAMKISERKGVGIC